MNQILAEVENMARINVEFNKRLGAVKPMHAVNNGPVSGRKTQKRSRSNLTRLRKLMRSILKNVKNI